MNQPVLIVDDDADVCASLKNYLESINYPTFVANNISKGRTLLAQERIRAILLDLNLPDGSGLNWISEIKEEWPQVAILVITGQGDVPTAVHAMRRGADHFATKPIDIDDLTIILEKCLEIGSLRRATGLQARHKTKESPFFGKSAALAPVIEEARLAAASEAPTLLQGETGSGKTLIARWIHEQSARRNGPFIEINCGGLRGEMLASELFGHARGAFTGAVDKKQGLVEIADEGTLFLDEIGDMDPEVQSHLLKVLETKSFRRLGEVRDRRSDFRLICATNRDLQQEVTRGKFRQDLFFRIAVLTVSVPALRNCLSDLPDLCYHILKSMSRTIVISQEAVERLQSYQWPGNVRELRNVIERAVLLCGSGPILPKHLPFDTPGMIKEDNSVEDEIRQKEADHIAEVIARCKGDVGEAAKILGLSRATLYRRLSAAKRK
ncbi:MAG: sigma-54-dependent Fis family transcriptional regulator [Acidobacteria bacterium]|nr:MAG: sigma-54-dependent Fis family transcriptional regulator [Acidobacteriota bacterium]